MNTSDFLTFAGDVRLDQVTLTSIPTGNSFNIINQVIGVQIFEDLYSPHMSGNIIVKDSLDILNNLPITGQELLDIKIKTPSLPDDYDLSGKFYIYKMTDREYVAEKNVIYKLHFISLNAFVDSTTKISKGYKGKVSQIAQEILFAWVGQARVGVIEETKNSTRYVSNFWTPSKNLNYLTNQAINTKDSPSFLFFENRLGYNFMSLDLMYRNEIYQTFNFNMKAREVLPTGQSARVMERDYQRINEMILPDSFDNISRNNRSGFASTLHSFDTVTKRYDVLYYQYLDKFPKQKHLNNYALTAESMRAFFNPSSSIIFDNRQFGLFNDYGDVSNTKILQERLNQLALSEGLIVRIVVPGRTDYTVGQKVKLRVMQPQPTKETDDYESEEDKIFSGDYLISAINHSISRERHECTIELVKDSWMKNINAFNEK